MQADAIDPQAKAAVEQQEWVPIPHSRLGLKLLRLVSRPLLWLENRDPPPVGQVIDRTIPGPGGDLDVRLYLPDKDGPVPTVVFFHGGGFVLGSIATHDWLCRQLTIASGCGILSVDYRLAPEHPYPAAVEDAYAAVEWAATNPSAVHGTGRLAVAGDSAGGTLAAVAALMAADRGGPDIDYQVLLYPGVGVKPDQTSITEHAGIVLDGADLQWFRECYYGGDPPADDPYADPANATDLSGVPPATVITAGFDPLRDGGKAYADQLRAAGVPTHYENYEAMVHGFLTFRDVDRTREAIESIAADLAGALGNDGMAQPEAVGTARKPSE